MFLTLLKIYSLLSFLIESIFIVPYSKKKKLILKNKYIFICTLLELKI
jgi:hypothetical protein